MRLESKTAIIVGAGQGPGTGMGNGRATALRFAQEGAKVMSVDRELRLAEETAAMVRHAGGDCFAFEADVTRESAKAAMIAFTEQLAIQNAEYGVRANVILPGLMDTPMAVDTRARKTGKSRAEVAAMRDARVPLRRKMGTAWDVANAALFLASDEANFITGVSLLVDGGGALDIGH